MYLGGSIFPMSYYVTDESVPVCGVNILWQVMYQIVNLIQVLVCQTMKRMINLAWHVHI